MDNLSIVDTRYAGDQQSFWWPRATVTMTTVAKNAVLVIDGIKKQTTITTIDTQNPLQARQAVPTPDANPITIDGRLLVPQDIMIYKETNPRDFEAHWQAVDLAKVILARELPATAAAYIVSQVLRRAFQSLDQGVWIGSTAYQNGAVAKTDVRYQYSFFDGFIKLFLNDVNVISVPSVATFTTPVAPSTPSNIIGFMQSCINLCNPILQANPLKFQRLKFAMSVTSFNLFAQSLTLGTSFKNLDYASSTPEKFQGYDVIVLYGMPDNTVVFGEFLDDGTGNFALGMNAMEDMQLELRKLQANAETWFVKGLLKMAVQYGWGDQIVLATTLTTNSFLP